jgi:hypothetical protein
MKSLATLSAMKHVHRLYLLGHAAQRSHAVAVTACVDATKLAVESIRHKIFSLPGFGRRNKIFAREPGNHLANSIIFQDNEIAIVVRKAIFAIQGLAFMPCN